MRFLEINPRNYFINCGVEEDEEAAPPVLVIDHESEEEEKEALLMSTMDVDEEEDDDPVLDVSEDSGSDESERRFESVTPPLR